MIDQWYDAFKYKHARREGQCGNDVEVHPRNSPPCSIVRDGLLAWTRFSLRFERLLAERLVKSNYQNDVSANIRGTTTALLPHRGGRIAVDRAYVGHQICRQVSVKGGHRHRGDGSGTEPDEAVRPHEDGAAVGDASFGRIILDEARVLIFESTAMHSRTR
jgi:hypothetical protein